MALSRVVEHCWLGIVGKLLLQQEAGSIKKGLMTAVYTSYVVHDCRAKDTSHDWCAYYS